MTSPLLVVLVAACGRVGFDAVPPDGSTTGDGSLDAPAPCTAWSNFSAPTSVTELNTGATDWAPSISPDGLVMTFSSTMSGNEEIYRATRSSTTQAWGAPTIVADLIDPGDDEDDPTVSSDGLEIFFGKNQLFAAKRTSTTLPFGPRSVLVDQVGMTLVQGAELTSDDLSLYFNAKPGGGPNKIFLMQRATRGSPFGPFSLIQDPDPSGDTGYPTLSTDELEMWFASDRTTDRKIRHSTRATRTDPFSMGVVVTELDSSFDEWDPEISSDGSTMWFSSSRDGSQDIFVSTRTCLSP